MRIIKKCAVWFLSEIKWACEYQILHLKAFNKEIGEVFGVSVKGIAYRLVFSVGLGTILFFFSISVHSAYKVVVLEMPFTREYVAGKIYQPKRITIVNPTVAKKETVEEVEEEPSGPKFQVEMSAYTSRIEETDGSPCISADNSNICEYDGCVVASNDFKMGSVIDVEGFGECTVKDRMNSRYSFEKTGKYNVDMYMKYDLDKALAFGRKIVQVEVK